MSRLRENLSTGLWWGTRYALVYSVVGVTIAIARRGTLEAYSLTLLQLIALYVAAGIGGGALTGLLLPFVRSQISAGVVGFVVTLPIMFMFGMAMYSDEIWSSEVTSAWIISAILLGPACGVGLWRIDHCR
jgi:hypothetical protein